MGIVFGRLRKPNPPPGGLVSALPQGKLGEVMPLWVSVGLRLAPTFCLTPLHSLIVCCKQKCTLGTGWFSKAPSQLLPSRPGGTGAKNQDHQHQQCEGGRASCGVGISTALPLLPDSKGKCLQWQNPHKNLVLACAAGALVVELALLKEWQAGEAASQEPCLHHSRYCSEARSYSLLL